MPYTVRAFLSGLGESMGDISKLLLQYQMYKQDQENIRFSQDVAFTTMQENIREGKSRTNVYDEQRRYYEQRRMQDDKVYQREAEVLNLKTDLVSAFKSLDSAYGSGDPVAIKKAKLEYNRTRGIYRTSVDENWDYLSERTQKALQDINLGLGGMGILLHYDDMSREELAKRLDVEFPDAAALLRGVRKDISEKDGGDKRAEELRYLTTWIGLQGAEDTRVHERTMSLTPFKTPEEILAARQRDFADGGMSKVLADEFDDLVKQADKMKKGKTPTLDPSVDSKRWAAGQMFENLYVDSYSRSISLESSESGLSGAKVMLRQRMSEMFEVPFEELSRAPRFFHPFLPEPFSPFRGEEVGRYRYGEDRGAPPPIAPPESYLDRLPKSPVGGYGMVPNPYIGEQRKR